MARTTIVTHPDGTISKRTSKSRTYSHAVEVSPADPKILADYLTLEARNANAHAAKLDEAAESATCTRKARGWSNPDTDYDGKPSYSGFVARLGNTEVTWYCNSQNMAQVLAGDDSDETWAIVPVDGYLREQARAQAKGERERADDLRELAKAIRAGGEVPARYGNAYGVLRWSSRADLAAKGLTEFEGLARYGCTLRVVECHEA